MLKVVQRELIKEEN